MGRYKVQRIVLDDTDYERSDLVTKQAAAKLLGVSVQTVSQAMDRGGFTVIVDTEAPNPWPGGRLLLREEVINASASDNDTLVKTVLTLTLEEEAEYVRITAHKDGQGARTERIDNVEFRRGILYLYEALESRYLSARGKRMLKTLGGLVLEPFQSLIQSSDEIVFVVPDTLLEIPIDLLHHKGQPLFLQRPVSYRLAPDLGNDSALFWPASALMISDVTADPELAVKSVASIFDEFTYVDAAEVGPLYLRQQHESDLLLMSVHGKIDNSSRDHVILGSEAAAVTDFATIKPRIAFFDSCRLGVSSRFLDGFTEMGTKYFVAPILSNEAGNSSTMTIQVFFKHLLHSKRPEVALFHTRKVLWDAYRDDHFVYRAWRGFPFRVYRLN